jgi:transcriptional regulator with GAF, ATPase, and Fis domain
MGANRPAGAGTVRDEPISIGARAHRAEPHLFVVMECRRPLAGGARASLQGVERVTFGRGEVRSLEHGADLRTLDVRIPDPAISQRHASLVRDGAAWVLEDLASTNGTRVDGESIGRAALRDGAVVELGSTLLVVRFALATPSGTARTVSFDATARGQDGLATLVPEYAHALATFARVSMSHVSLLLLGESGTGKEVLARAAHGLSGRKGAFVPLNCGALPASLVEAQLFGHVRGAFSGAQNNQPGFVRSSDGGTLFLDEIGDLPLPAQAALLRVLQEKEVTPIGSASRHPVDLRVVAATHRRIDAQATQVDGASFRGDLYARLAGFTHGLPPLRERREDIGLLLRDLLPTVAPQRAPDLRLSVELGRALLSHDWPFNVRELQQALSVATVLATDVVRLAHAPEALRVLRGRSAPETATVPPAVGSAPRAAGPTTPRVGGSTMPRPELSSQDRALKETVETALRTHRGNVSEVARVLGKTRMQVHRWMRRFDLDVQRFRA